MWPVTRCTDTCGQWQGILIHVASDKVHWYMWPLTRCTGTCDHWQGASIHVASDKVYWYMWPVTRYTDTCGQWKVTPIHVAPDKVHWYIWPVTRCTNTCGQWQGALIHNVTWPVTIGALNDVASDTSSPTAYADCSADICCTWITTKLLDHQQLDITAVYFQLLFYLCLASW